ncbi:hypothetical protein D3C73_1362740 [compost metagenome]
MAAVILNQQMPAQRIQSGGNAPDMQIMDVNYTADAGKRRAHISGIHRERGAFHQDVKSLLNHAPGTPQNEQRYNDTDDRIGDVPGEQAHEQPGQQGADRAQGIAENVQISAADIDILVSAAFAHERPGAYKIGQ